MSGALDRPRRLANSFHVWAHETEAARNRRSSDARMATHARCREMVAWQEVAPRQPSRVSLTMRAKTRGYQREVRRTFHSPFRRLQSAVCRFKIQASIDVIADSRLLRRHVVAQQQPLIADVELAVGDNGMGPSRQVGAIRLLKTAAFDQTFLRWFD